MQTLLVVEEGRRSGNAGDASRYRPEALHSLDASRFIGVSFSRHSVDLRACCYDTDAQNAALLLLGVVTRPSNDSHSWDEAAGWTSTVTWWQASAPQSGN